MRTNAFLGELVNAPLVMNQYSYNFSLFGEPSRTQPWGWSLFGHHLCLNCFVLNQQMVLSPDFAALRVVLFGNHDAGYLTRTYPTQPNGPGASDPDAIVPRTSVDNQGADTSYGGSVALLVRPVDSLDIRLGRLERRLDIVPVT